MAVVPYAKYADLVAIVSELAASDPRFDVDGDHGCHYCDGNQWKQYVAAMVFKTPHDDGCLWLRSQVYRVETT